MVKQLSAQQKDFQYCRQLLHEPGEINFHLEQALPNEPNFDQRYDISDGRQSCKLDEIPENEEIFYPENDELIDQCPYFIADTKPGPGDPEKGWKNGRKGHEVRNIGVWHEHGEIPPVNETYFKGSNMAERLRDVTAEQMEDGYEVVFGSMQSFKDDFHFVASDLETNPSAEPDLYTINSWFLYEIDGGEPTELVEYQSRDVMGEYLEQLLL